MQDSEGKEIEEKVDPQCAFLPLTGFWFDQIKTGKKSIEFRRASRHWLTRIFGKTHCVFQRGPLAAFDTGRVMDMI